MSGIDEKNLDAAHFDEERHGYSKKRKYAGKRATWGPSRRRTLSFK